MTKEKFAEQTAQLYKKYNIGKALQSEKMKSLFNEAVRKYYAERPDEPITAEKVEQMAQDFKMFAFLTLLQDKNPLSEEFGKLVFDAACENYEAENGTEEKDNV